MKKMFFLVAVMYSFSGYGMDKLSARFKLLFLKDRQAEVHARCNQLAQMRSEVDKSVFDPRIKAFFHSELSGAEMVCSEYREVEQLRRIHGPIPQAEVQIRRAEEVFLDGMDHLDKKLTHAFVLHEMLRGGDQSFGPTGHK